MKPSRLLLFRYLTGVAPLFVAGVLYAAPLTWFPGPSLQTPVSGAATTVASGLGNVLIGGDSYFISETYPEYLTVTNIYWTYLSVMYGARIAAGAVANGDQIIVYGGTDGTNSTSSVSGYSPSGDTPPTLASMSVARAYLGYTADSSGNPYGIGGLDDNGQPLASAERYDPDANTWTSIASLPVAQYNFPAVLDRTNQIYVFGGRTNTTDGTETATVLRYSVRANTWTSMAPMLIPVAGSVAAFGADGRIYVVGGVSGGVTTNVVQVYDPAANSWVISTPLPEGLSAAAMGVDSLGRLIVMGGVDTNGDDVGDVWRSQRLGVPDTAPIFTQYPGATNGGYLIPYTSSINATGNPQPTYLLFSGPDGMQVDTYTGAITWTPQASQIGSNSVTIRATNYAGFADWTYRVTVAPPPPTPPTNLTVVGETENSVAFFWDPEDPLVGPVTYDVYERIVHITRTGGYATYDLVSSGSPNTTVTIGGLATGTSHTYVVVAVAAATVSGMSQFLTITTLKPQPPTNLRVTGLTSTTITLAWDASPGPVPIASYEVWGWINNGVTSAIYGTGITNTAFTITGLVPGSTHEWGVRAHDAGGYASGFDYGPTVMNPVPVAPLVSGGGRLSNGDFQFTVQEAGPVVQTVLIQATSNPTDPAGWVQIGSVLPGSAVFTFTDTNAAQYPMRFYRISAP
jgi:hypothetical protein